MDGGAFSPSWGVAGVAPVCALAGAFAKASAQASGGLGGVVWFAEAKRAGRERPTGKQIVNDRFMVLHIFEGGLGRPGVSGLSRWGVGVGHSPRLVGRSLAISVVVDGQPNRLRLLDENRRRIS